MKKILLGLKVIALLASGFVTGVVFYKPEQKIFGGGGVSFTSFSGNTTNQTLSVTQSTSVLSNNNGRIYAAFSNNTTGTIIYLNLGTASTTADDYTISIPAGGRYELKTENLYTGPVYASSSITSSLLIFEK